MSDKQTYSTTIGATNQPKSFNLRKKELERERNLLIWKLYYQAEFPNKTTKRPYSFFDIGKSPQIGLTNERVRQIINLLEKEAKHEKKSR